VAVLLGPARGIPGYPPTHHCGMNIMADEMVRRAQEMVNRLYGNMEGMPQLDEDGETGWVVPCPAPASL
jgi:hypothetical protein